MFNIQYVDSMEKKYVSVMIFQINLFIYLHILLHIKQTNFLGYGCMTQPVVMKLTSAVIFSKKHGYKTNDTVSSELCFVCPFASIIFYLTCHIRNPFEYKEGYSEWKDSFRFPLLFEAMHNCRGISGIMNPVHLLLFAAMTLL